MNLNKILSIYKIVIKPYLTDREYDIVTRDKGITFENIANKLGLSKERVRQIESKAYKKLTKQAYLLKEIDFLNDEIYRLRQSYSYHYSEKLNLEKYIHNLKKQNDLTDSILYKEICEIGISARLYNCLTNYGIKYVIDICNTERKDLYNIRNFGAKNMQELDIFMERKDLKYKECGY